MSTEVGVEEERNTNIKGEHRASGDLMVANAVQDKRCKQCINCGLG